MFTTIGDLYMPDKEVGEVVLDIGGKVKLDQSAREEVARIESKLERNERVPSYRSRRTVGSKLVLECEETDFATNVAIIKRRIPWNGLMPMGVVGVPKVIDGIALGLTGFDNQYSPAKVQAIPAGMINIDELDPDKMSPLESFYNELLEETNLDRRDTHITKFLGMVYDRQHNQLAIAYGYDTGLPFAQFANRMSEATDKEYEFPFRLPSRADRIVNYLERDGEHSIIMTHCRGAVILYALSEFPRSKKPWSLVGKEGKLFGYFN